MLTCENVSQEQGDVMSTDLLLDEVDQPPNSDNRKKKSHHLLSILFFSFLLLLAFSLRFHLSYFTGVRYIAACYENIQQTIDDYPALRWTYSLIDPASQKKQEAIQEILAVLEKHETGLAEVSREELAEVIYEESTRNNHDPKFILAFIAIESSFQNGSVSEAGAKGLMQIMPYVAEPLAQKMGIEWSGDRTLFNPFLNIKMGVHYLTRLLLDFKDPELAVTAYNYGPTYVKGLIEKKKKIPQDFYEKITARYHDLVASTNRENSPRPDDEQLTEFPI